MIDSAIDNFFIEQKAKWLKNKLAVGMTDLEINDINEQCEKKFELSNWLPDAARRAGQIAFSSHPCTFSHPSGRKNKNGNTSSIIAEKQRSEDGFLRTGNLEVEIDALGNAAALDVHKFLSLSMSDGGVLLNHLKNNTELAQKLLESVSDPEIVRQGFLEMAMTKQKMITSSKIKQVYFPIEENEYHLLSILTHSGHLYELRNRIDDIRFGETAKEAREYKKENKFHEVGYREIYDLTMIGFGGSKPQNISVLNNQYGGKAYLLPSVPPVLVKRNVRVAKTNFFHDCINPWSFERAFKALNRLFNLDINNKNIRSGIEFHIQEYVDFIIYKILELRNFYVSYLGDLSDDLPLEQKIMLYPNYENERIENDDWLNEVSLQIARSLVTNYKIVIKNAVSTADAELLKIKSIVETNLEYLR